MSEQPKRALVLGASSPKGIGEAVARRLSHSGYEVIVAGRRRKNLDVLAEEIAGKALTCDIADEDNIAAMFRAVGSISLAVNCAGTTDVGSIAKIRKERIEAQLAIHVTSNLLFMKHALPQLRSPGAIVLLSSLTARVPGTGLAAYSGAKAALEHIVRIAALEFGPRAIRVNAVAPGFTLTPMTEEFLADERIAGIYTKETALGALTTPAQVASAVLWLAADDCFVTGETIAVSGGAQLLRLPSGAELRG